MKSNHKHIFREVIFLLPTQRYSKERGFINLTESERTEDDYFPSLGSQCIICGKISPKTKCKLPSYPEVTQFAELLDLENMKKWFPNLEIVKLNEFQAEELYRIRK